jgi:hypothetical protein
MAPKSQDIVLDLVPDMNLPVYQLTINSNIIFTDSSIIPKIGRINLESSNPLNKYVALINDTVTLKFETLDTNLLVSKVLIGNQEVPFNRIVNGNLVTYSASIKAQDLVQSGKLNYTIVSNSSTISSDTSKRTVEVIKNMKDIFSTISFFDKNNVKITKTNTNLLEAKILMELTSDHYALINDLKQNTNSILKNSCQNKSCKFESDIKVLNINEPLEIQGSLLNTTSIFPIKISDYIEAPITKDPVKPDPIQEPIKSTSPQINSRADLTYLQNNFSGISMAGKFPAVLKIDGLKDVDESVRQAYISSQGLTLLNLTNNLVIKELDFNYSLSSTGLSIDPGSLMNMRLNSEDIPRIISSRKLKNSLVLDLNNFKKANIYILKPDGTYNKIPKKDLIITANKIKVKQSSISSEALYLIVVSPYGNDFIKLK